MILVSAFTTLDKIASIKDKQERRTALREVLARSRPLAMLVQYAYHPDVIFDLPEGPTPTSLIRPSRHDDYSLTYRSVKRLRNLFKGSPVSKINKENLWVGLLNDVVYDDVALLEGVRIKRLPWKTLNKSFVVKTCPELFPRDIEVVEEVE